MRICLVLEGCYPYVHGGVSTWMHSYIEAMKEHEFVLWVIGAKAEDRGKFVYDLPSNVVEVHEVFLDDALRLSGERAQVSFTEEELRSLRELVNLGSPDWDVLFNLFHTKGVHPLSFLQSREFIDLFTQICMEEYPYVAYADAFHTVRSMLLPVLYLMGSEVPEAQIYHAISTGYGGLLACLGGVSTMHRYCLRNMAFIRVNAKRKSFPPNGCRQRSGRVGSASSICFLNRFTIAHGVSLVCSVVPVLSKSVWVLPPTPAGLFPTAFNTNVFAIFP